jgi:hypothetical protein
MERNGGLREQEIAPGRGEGAGPCGGPENPEVVEVHDFPKELAERSNDSAN